IVPARGLSDLRTATTSRVHAKPPQKGAEYLNLYLLDKESQRLEAELGVLDHRRKRIQAHLEEIRKAMATVGAGAPRAERVLISEGAALESPMDRDRQRGPWKKMSVDY
ncbi:MAG: hypothetical protein Q8R28_23470, partial [Dehalococcoidia bacterium]|nr:hypothetical protein [Dehalococcoidia bacterium]